MARVRIILEDDFGQSLIEGGEQLYSLEGPCNTLDAIESAVEEWRKKALPDIEHALLTKAQQDAVAKKTQREVQWNLCPAGANATWTIYLRQSEVLLSRKGQ